MELPFLLALIGLAIAAFRAWQVGRLLLDADVFASVLEKLLRSDNLERARKLCAVVPETPLGAATAALVSNRTLPKGAKEPEVRDILRAAFVEAFSSKAATITSFRFVSLASLVASSGALGLAYMQNPLSWKAVVVSAVGLLVLGWSVRSAYKILGSGPIVLERLLPKMSALLTGATPSYRTPDAESAPKLEESADKPRPPPDLGSVVIDVHRGSTSEGTLTFEQSIIKIGRVGNAHVRLDDPAVARMHAVIERAGSEVSIIDLGSSTGVVVNAEKVHKATLSHGDVVEIGPYRLTIGLGRRPQVELVEPSRVQETDDPKTWSDPAALFYGFEARSPDLFYEIVFTIASKAGHVRIAKLAREDAPRFVVALFGAESAIAEARGRIERETKEHYGRFVTTIAETAPDAVYGAETSTHAKIRHELSKGELRVVTTARV